MIKPIDLKRGDKIAIVAPAGKIEKEKVFAAVEVFKSWGLKVIIGKNTFNDHFQYAASDEERLSDVQKALNDDSVKAIIFARGGYGSNRIIDQLDFANFQKNPKWLVGFSDITVFHSHIHTNYKIETLHTTMTAGISPDESDLATTSLMKALFGEELKYTFKTHPLSIHGKAKGVLVGGNLAILCSLTGTSSDINTDGKILFLEEIGEHHYKIDRMLLQLKRAGKLENLAGLIVGGMTDLPDDKSEFGMDANEIILEKVKGYNYPVCFDFPAGHQTDNRALILGCEVEINIADKTFVYFG